MEQSKQFRKNFIWNILGTGFNAFNSLFFMIIVTRINGVNDAGIFTIAFSTACILYIVGIYAGRIYQVTEPNKEINDKEYILNRIITFITMIVLVLIFNLIKGYNFYKSVVFILLCLYKALEAFSDVFYGILQKNEKLDIVGKSLFIKSFIGVVLFFLVDYYIQNMIISILAIVLVSLLITIFYDIRHANKFINKELKVKIKNVWIIFRKGFYTFAITFFAMYVSNSPKYAIDSYLESNYQTIFGIIVMPATVIGLVAQFLIHPFLTQILELYNKRDLKNLNKLSLKLIGIILGFGLVASLVIYLCGPEILGLIYGINLTTYRVALVIIIFAAILYTIATVYSSILTTVRETLSQFIIYVIVAIFALFTTSLCTKWLNIDGAVLSYFFVMAIDFIIYSLYTNIKIKKIFRTKEQLVDEKSNSNSASL